MPPSSSPPPLMARLWVAAVERLHLAGLQRVDRAAGQQIGEGLVGRHRRRRGDRDEGLVELAADVDGHRHVLVLDAPFGDEIECRLRQRRVVVRETPARDADVLAEGLVLARDDVDRALAARDVRRSREHRDRAAELCLETVAVDPHVVAEHDVDLAADAARSVEGESSSVSMPTMRSSGEVLTEVVRSLGAISADGMCTWPVTR